MLDKFTWQCYTTLANKTWQGGMIVNKEQLLEMSRKENKNGDEREEKIKLRSYAISSCVGALICLTLVILEGTVFDRSTTVIWMIYCGMMFSKPLLDAIRLKKKSDLLLAIVWGVVLTVHIVLYVLENIG